jgi:transcriptional regulator MraZ
MFRGRFPHTMDGKGRLSIPAKYREVLAAQEERVLLLLELDNCITAIPEKEWQKFEAKLSERGPMRPEVREYLRTVYSSAIETEVDGAGRILVPPSFRETVGLARDVVIVGVMNRFEIWAKDRWEHFVRSKVGQREEIMDKLAEYL